MKFFDDMDSDDKSLCVAVIAMFAVMALIVVSVTVEKCVGHIYGQPPIESTK